MTEKTLGIDISRWQDDNSTAQKMDFAKAYSAGARFVFIKSSQQLRVDEDILYNWKAAKDAGLLRGAYHFLTWDKPAKDQARYAWSVIQSDPGEIPPTVDFEWWNGQIPSYGFSMVWDWLMEMKYLCGRTPILYTGYSIWINYGRKDPEWAQFPLWLAYYAAEQYVKIPPPFTRFTFWQYTNKGDGLKFGAESKELDMDWFNGTYDDLLKFCGIQQAEPPPPPAEEQPTLQEITLRLEEDVKELKKLAFPYTANLPLVNK